MAKISRMNYLRLRIVTLDMMDFMCRPFPSTSFCSVSLNRIDLYFSQVCDRSLEK